MKSFDVFKRTDEDLTGFLKLLPLLRYLKHSSMKERHWEMVKDVLRVRALQVDSPTFRLKDALRLDLVTNEAELNEVVVRAQKEEAMEATLKIIAGDALLIHTCLYLATSFVSLIILEHTRHRRSEKRERYSSRCAQEILVLFKTLCCVAARNQLGMH